MPTTRSAFSRVGLPYESAVDVDALSDKAKLHSVIVPVVIGTAAGGTSTAYMVINATTDHPVGTLGVACTLVGASYSSDRVPSIGTGSVSVWAATTDGTTKTQLFDANDPEALTVNVGRPLTLSSTNRALASTDVLFFRCVADNSTITTDLRNVKLTLHYVVTEADPPTR